MGKSQRDKGARCEREIAKLLGAERVPLSGACGGRYSGDLDHGYLGRGEVKVRGNGFKQLYDWLGENDFLCVKADRKPWLVVMRASDVKQLIDEMDEIKEELTRKRRGKYGA